MAEKKLTFGFYGKFQNLLSGVEQAKNALVSLDGIVKSVGIAFALNFGKQKANEFVDFADKMNDLSQKTGESVENIQKWNNAIKSAGGDADGFNRVLSNLADELNVPWKDGNLKAMFRTLGIQAHDASGKMRRPLEMIADLSEKLKGMDESAVTTFGEKFGFDQKTINLLKEGRGQLAEYLDKGKKMGVFSKEQIARGAELKRTFQEMKTASTLFGLQIGSVLTPLIASLAGAFRVISDWFKNNERIVRATVIAGAFLGIVKAIKAFDLAAKISALTNPYVLLFGAIVAALALLVEDFLAFKDGAESLLPWDKIINVTKSFVNVFKGLFDKVFPIIKGVFSAVTGVISSFVEFVTNMFMGGDLLSSLLNFGNQIESVFSGIAESIIGAFTSAFDFITSAFSKVTDKISKGWKTFKGWFGFGEDDSKKDEEAISTNGMLEEKIPSVPEAASVQNSNSSVVNNANRTMTIQKVEIKTDKIDSESFASVAEKASGFDTFQANYGG